eukprot:5158293-Pyramimonas_sp.AAC.1
MAAGLDARAASQGGNASQPFAGALCRGPMQGPYAGDLSRGPMQGLGESCYSGPLTLPPAGLVGAQRVRTLSEEVRCACAVLEKQKEEETEEARCARVDEARRARVAAGVRAPCRLRVRTCGSDAGCEPIQGCGSDAGCGCGCTCGSDAGCEPI